MMQKLSILIVVFSIILMGLCGVYFATANDTITNEIAIEQLNGGDEEYIEMQIHNEYKKRLTAAILTTSFANVVLIGIVIGSAVTTYTSNQTRTNNF